MEDIINYLASDNYIVVNKTLIKAFGLNEAVMLGELCTEYRYWAKEGRLEDDMFFSTINNIEENTGLTAHEQRQAIKSLENAGVLTTELRGLPAKKYFKLDISTVVKILTTCSADFLQLAVKNQHLNNNNKNNNKNINILSKDSILSGPGTTFTFGTKQTQPKQSMWNKCVSYIDDFTSDKTLRSKLIAALTLFLDNSKESGIAFYTNNFKGKLNALQKLSEDVNIQIQIVQQTLDNGWNGFYEIKQNNNRKTNNFAEDVEHLTGGLNERAKKGGIKSGQKF